MASAPIRRWALQWLGVIAIGLGTAAPASAYSVEMIARGPVTSLTASDDVIIDVYLDTDPGLQRISLSVLYPGDGTLTYDGPASAALPTIAPNGYGNGAQPSYILYVGMCTGFGMAGACIVYPGTTPYWLNTTFTPPPGKEQIDVDYQEGGFRPVTGSGSGIYIATLLFHIEPGFDFAEIELCVDCDGNELRANDQILDPAASIGVGAPIVLTGLVPEPGTALLVSLGALAAVTAGRRR